MLVVGNDTCMCACAVQDVWAAPLRTVSNHGGTVWPPDGVPLRAMVAPCQSWHCQAAEHVHPISSAVWGRSMCAGSSCPQHLATCQRHVSSICCAGLLLCHRCPWQQCCTCGRQCAMHTEADSPTKVQGMYYRPHCTDQGQPGVRLAQHTSTAASTIAPGANTALCSEARGHLWQQQTCAH